MIHDRQQLVVTDTRQSFRPNRLFDGTAKRLGVQLVIVDRRCFVESIIDEVFDVRSVHIVIVVADKIFGMPNRGVDGERSLHKFFDYVQRVVLVFFFVPKVAFDC